MLEKENGLLTPLLDITFKSMFTKDRDDSRKALRCFVSALINEKVVEVTILNNDVPLAECINDKNIRLDLNCKLEDGRLVDIEMQMQDEYYNHGNRLEYYLSRLVSTQESVNNDYDNLRRTYQIMIANFSIFDDDDEDVDENRNPVQRFAMRTEDGLQLTNPSLMNIVTLELSKLKKPKQLSKMSDEELEKWILEKTPAEQWIMFLKWATNENANRIVKIVSDKIDGVNEAKEVLMELSRTTTERELARMRNKAVMDFTSSMNANFKRGVKIGFDDGVSQGMQQGIEKGLQQGIEKGLQQGIEKGLQQGIEKGLQQGIEKGLQQGIEKGLQQGIEKGLQQGIEKGMQQGLQQGILQGASELAKLLQSGISLEEALKKLNLN